MGIVTKGSVVLLDDGKYAVIVAIRSQPPFGIFYSVLCEGRVIEIDSSQIANVE